MVSIQDINELEYAIAEVVQEFIDCADSYEHPSLKITRKPEGIIPDIVECDNFYDNGDEATYSMWDLVYTEQDGTPSEPNWDEINEIANKWMFLGD